MRSVAEIHDEIAAKGFPVETVRSNGGRVEVVLRDGATPAQRAQADALVASILDRPERPELGPAQPVTIEDALVVLACEPDHEGARAILRARYESLKEQR